MDVPVNEHCSDHPLTVDCDLPFLVDSGTESYTESPIAEEESEQSEDSTICDIGKTSC